jgi:hypothetical protein
MAPLSLQLDSLLELSSHLEQLFLLALPSLLVLLFLLAPCSLLALLFLLEQPSHLELSSLPELLLYKCLLVGNPVSSFLLVGLLMFLLFLAKFHRK